MTDMVNHPPHYTSHPSGIEAIQITRHMGFNLGNALKYIWRADLKGSAIEDLKKAAFYIADEIAKREAEEPEPTKLAFRDQKSSWTTLNHEMTEAIHRAARTIPTLVADAPSSVDPISAADNLRDIEAARRARRG